MNRNLSWSQFGPYVPKNGASDLKDNAAMSVSGGGMDTFPADRKIPPKKNTLSALGAMNNAMILGQTSPN